MCLLDPAASRRAGERSPLKFRFCRNRIGAARPVCTLHRLGETMDQLKKLVDEDLAHLNQMMNEAGIPHISVPEGVPPAT